MMLKPSEKRKIEAIESYWDGLLQDFNNWWQPTWRKFRREFKIVMDMIFNWYFFYQAKSKGDKAFHILEWLAVNFVALRVLGFI